MKPEALNCLDRARFLELFGAVFEDSLWVAERAWQRRPFLSREHLLACMTDIVSSATRDEQFALLRAHPDLGTRARVSLSSEREQAGAGLDRLTPEEHQTLLRLNHAYWARFTFPFLYAVKGSGKAQILDALRQRLPATPEQEFAEALRQVYRIASFRLENILS